jgi:hypothetical protein
MRGDSRNLHNTELYALCSSSNTTSVIKPRSMRWVGIHKRREIRLSRKDYIRWIINIKMDVLKIICKDIK